MAIRHVRRSDGTRVPFRERKVADAIARALAAAGTPDRGLAYELASVVSFFLAKTFAAEPPTTGDVRETLARVLSETGHGEAAACFEAEHRERERLERELTVRSERGLGEGPESEDGREELTPWSRARMVASLVRHRELPVSVAEEVVAAVEERLLAAGYQSVTQSLLREMVDLEFLEQGLEGVRDLDPCYRVRRSLVRQIVAPDAQQGARGLDRSVAGLVLESHALLDVHGDETAAAHRTGRLFIHGLGDPYRVERLVLPLQALQPAFEEELSSGLLRIRSGLDALRPHVRAQIHLPELLPALEALPMAREQPERLLEELLLLLDHRDVFGRLRGPTTCLECSLAVQASGARPFLMTLLERLGAGSSQGTDPVVAFRLPERGRALDKEVLAKALSLAGSRPGTHLVIPRDPARLEPSGRRVPVPLRLSLGRLTVNLPLAFANAQGESLKEVLPLLEKPGNLALKAFQERFWLQRGGCPHGLHGLVVGLGGPGRVQVRADGQEVDLEIWGLGLALDLLVERGILPRAQAAGAAARILGYLDYLLGARWEGLHFRVRLGGSLGALERRTLYQATRAYGERYGVEDLLLVLARSGSRSGLLPVAVPLLSEPNRPLLLAPFAERMAPGLLFSSAALAHGGEAASFFERLRDETRLGHVALAPRPQGDELFEVQEELFS